MANRGTLLSRAQVVQIRRLLKIGVKVKDVAARFDRSASTIYHLKKNNWEGAVTF